MEFRAIQANEMKQVQDLLKENKLPFEDLNSSKVDFVISVANEKIIGCIGIEKYSENALLRSFAVHDHYKGKGVGHELVAQLIRKSKAEKIKTIHLLTTTAENYFVKKGFQISERNNAPATIQNTTEFSDICPTSSAYMTCELFTESNTL